MLSWGLSIAHKAKTCTFGFDIMIMIPLSVHLIFFFPQFVPRSRVPVGKVLMKKTTNSLGRELAASDVAANFSFTH